MTGDENFIIGGDPRGVRMPGSRSEHCVLCGTETTFAPSGQRLLDAGYRPLCVPCGMLKAQADGEKVRLPSAKTIASDLRGFDRN